MTDREFGGWERNIYYNPAAAGFDLVATLDADLAYEFDLVILLRDLETGKLYAAADAGCSCPTPFEDYDRLSKLVPVTTEADVEALVTGRSYSPWSPGDVLTFMRTVREAL